MFVFGVPDIIFFTDVFLFILLRKIYANNFCNDSTNLIINRMNLDMFQYKLLIIPSNQDNHKSLFVVTGLQNVVKHGHRLGIGDHPCILHLESGKRQLNHSLTNVTAHNIRLLLNKLYRSHVKAENDKAVNPFSSRLMPLRPLPPGDLRTDYST